MEIRLAQPLKHDFHQTSRSILSERRVKQEYRGLGEMNIINGY